MVTASVTYLGGSKIFSRTARLLELLIRVQTKPRFTAAELAEEFGVSRRTMLRDLGALSAMGVPLRSTPGPGGGYSLPRGGRRLSPSLTVDEALALIISYEALLRYPDSPFSAQSLSAVTKLRAALPPDVVAELDRLRRHVAVVEPVREYEAPLLGELLEASLEEAHLKVAYDSIDGVVGDFEVGLFKRGLKQLSEQGSLVLAHRLYHGDVAAEPVQLRDDVRGQRRAQLGHRREALGRKGRIRVAHQGLVGDDQCQRIVHRQRRRESTPAPRERVTRRLAPASNGAAHPSPRGRAGPSASCAC